MVTLQCPCCCEWVDVRESMLEGLTPSEVDTVAHDCCCAIVYFEAEPNFI